MAEISPFDYINSINSSKKDLMETKEDEKTYNSFMVNRGLSYFPDTIEYANAMNQLYHLDSKLQYQYLINIVRPRKRFSKWSKKKKDGDLELVMRYFGYNANKAKSALSILTPDDLKTIKKKIDEGGT
jgi:hypothetical protein